jgi:nitrite reductase (NO-forming)
VTINVGDAMKFEPAAISVRAGQRLELTLRNSGHMPHDFTLSEGVAQPFKLVVNGGATVSGTFTIDKPGTYAFECSMPGHEMAGMRGTITAHYQ